MPGKTTPRKPVKAATKKTAAKATLPRKAATPSARKVAKSPTKKTARSTKRDATTSADAVPLLSGGNPQIPKGFGDAPVQAYIAAMPGWKSAAWRRLDALIEEAVPGLHKAVKWNSPLYGVTEGTWFLGVHCFTRYIKVSFFNGAALRPVPPGKSKMPRVRYLDIHEDDAIDETQFVAWVKQASKLPGERT
ncbi:DUF1801 domain-containing protein [Lysobacter sp. FW306-1B-D06B]|uniref:DUF1801 domain-containing protein n=1 Tax=Lysobacter sp. FW306-1B-D06B TaxID=3140250 RepID=UPI0031405036